MESSKEDNIKYIVFPSEVHTFVYCPRYYFFERYMPRRLRLRERFRLVLGKIFHILKGVKDRLSGYSVESTIYTVVGNVKIFGRPDSFKVKEDQLEVIERKSGKGPRDGAWLSDLLQASTYAFILSNANDKIRSATVVVEYRNRRARFEFNSDLADLVLKALEDLILVKYYGILPAANRGRRCEICPYREICRVLDVDLDDKKFEELFEPGSWVKQMNIIPSKDAYEKEERGTAVDSKN